MKVKKRILLTTASVVLLGAFAVGGMLAYLTDTDEVTNTFTVGNVLIDLTEPNYPGNDKTTDIVPNQEIKKDPKVTNTGKNDAIVFMKVTVPVKSVATANADGTLTEGRTDSNQLVQKTQELFTMNGTLGVVNNSQHKFNLDTDSAGRGWVELTDKEQTSADGITWTDFTAYSETGKYYYADGVLYRTYIFGYNTVLKPEDDKTTEYVDESCTTTIFDTVTFLNIVEGQITSGTQLDIKVDAYAIQADYINNIDTSDLNADTLSMIYDVYVKQNS